LHVTTKLHTSNINQLGVLDIKGETGGSTSYAFGVNGWLELPNAKVEMKS